MKWKFSVAVVPKWYENSSWLSNLNKRKIQRGCRISMGLKVKRGCRILMTWKFLSSDKLFPWQNKCPVHWLHPLGQLTLHGQLSTVLLYCLAQAHFGIYGFFIQPWVLSYDLKLMTRSLMAIRTSRITVTYKSYTARIVRSSLFMDFGNLQ